MKRIRVEKQNHCRRVEDASAKDLLERPARPRIDTEPLIRELEALRRELDEALVVSR
jgi:hypothetical protein